MPGNPLVRFDEGRVGRTRKVSPSLLLYRSSAATRFPLTGNPGQYPQIPILCPFSRESVWNCLALRSPCPRYRWKTQETSAIDHTDEINEPAPSMIFRTRGESGSFR